jgi:hypothetical protein
VWIGEARPSSAGVDRSGIAGFGPALLARSGLTGLDVVRQTTANKHFHFKHMNKFTFKNGYRVKGIDAQTAGTELARIDQQNGGLKAPDVVDEARPVDALLHPAFEWDDQVAAEMHRQDQARYLIRAIQVVPANNQPQSVYVHINSTNSYMPVETVVQQTDLYIDAYKSACARIKEAQTALAELEKIAANKHRPNIANAMAHLSNAQENLALAV